MVYYFAVAIGGALGATSRYWVYVMLENTERFNQSIFPYATLSVNGLGSLLLGISYVVLLEKLQLAAEWRAAIMVGFLGAFTTFSTFSMDALGLLQDGNVVRGMLYIIISVVLCIVVAWLGMTITRAL